MGTSDKIFTVNNAFLCPFQTNLMLLLHLTSITQSWAATSLLSLMTGGKERCIARTLQLCVWKRGDSQGFYFTFSAAARTKLLEPRRREASLTQLCSFIAHKIRCFLGNSQLGERLSPTYKIMFGADFVCLLPLRSAAGMGDRCTRRRIVEQDGDIFTSSFEHKMPPFKCKGTIGCWGCHTWWIKS